MSLSWSPWQTPSRRASGGHRSRARHSIRRTLRLVLDHSGRSACRAAHERDRSPTAAPFWRSIRTDRNSRLAQLALASIRNPDSLVSTGNNNYRVGQDTATPVVGQAGTGGRGAIVGGSLESSNVDMATEFTQLIIFQRSYSANARVITTTDQISQETINLKR